MPRRWTTSAPHAVVGDGDHAHKPARQAACLGQVFSIDNSLPVRRLVALLKQFCQELRYAASRVPARSNPTSQCKVDRAPSIF
jgi:hypothetical protein